MFLTKKWNEIMGPKDERLEAEENKSSKVMATILLAGAVLTMYYNLSLQQVAYVTDHPIMTPLGESVDCTQLLLTLTILAASITALSMQTRAGYFSSRKRFAEVDRIPWDYVTLVAVVCGLILGMLTCGLRILAEIQIVGIDSVMWFGDIAIGIVFFALGFGCGMALMAYTIHDAIKRRQKLERELED